MSGQDAIRGFVYQTIASALHFLVDADWEYLTVEPNTAYEKVDMLLEDDAGSKKCQQVKSSINNFEKADILPWLEKIVTDVPDAQQYELILIGPCSASVTLFINKVNARQWSELGAVLTPYSDRIRIELLTFNFNVLQGHVQNEVHRFLSKQELVASHDTLVMVTGGLLYQFFQFAVLSTRASRAQWREELIGWLTRNYPRALNLEPRQDRLAVGIYQDGNRKLLTASTPFQYQFDVSLLLDGYMEKALNHFNQVASIPLPPSLEDCQPESENWSKLIIMSSTDYRQVKITSAEQDYLKRKVATYLNQQIPAGFFQIGNLTYNLWQPGIFGYAIGYKGTPKEEEKYAAIRKLRYALEAMDELSATFEFVNQLYCLPLVLENAGSRYDEEVVVTLKLPAAVQLVRSDTFHLPDDGDLLKLLTKEGHLTDLLYHQGDSLVDGYPAYPTDPFDPNWETYLGILSPSDQEKQRKERLIRNLGNLFNREIFDDLPGFTQIRYEFPKINPNKRIAFPSYLLFNATDSFVIEYEIISRNTAAVQMGQITVDI